jgi:hypothetical protein
MPQHRLPPEPLHIAAAAVCALPYELAALIFLSATGSSPEQICRATGVNLHELGKLRMQVAKAFGKQIRLQHPPTVAEQAAERAGREFTQITAPAPEGVV